MILYVSIFFDIPLLRQIIAFCFLTFVPGFAILENLKFRGLSVTDIFLFSVGLSIFFIMFIGLLSNAIFPFFGVNNPLSTLPVAFTIGFSTLVLFGVAYRREFSKLSILSDKPWIIKKPAIAKSMILFFPIVLGTLGALYLNVTLLLLMFVVIAVLFIVTGFSETFFSAKYYAVLIFAISIALLFHVVFTSKYVMGSDSQLEYYVFRLTQISGHWGPLDSKLNPLIPQSYNSLISITILPTIYSAILNVNGETVFKIFYTFVFALVPVVLYRTYEQMGKLPSLLSALFFISGSLVFYGVEPLSLGRQIVAELFFALSIFVLLNKTMSIKRRRLLLLVFGISIMFSHYSIMYFYLAYILAIFVLSKIRHEKDALLNNKIVFSLSAITLVWYTFSSAPLQSLDITIYRLINRFFVDLNNPATKSTEVFSSHPILGIASAFNWVFFYAANLLLIVGFLAVMLNWEKSN